MISPLYSADKGEKGFKSQKDIAVVIDRNFLINTAVPAADFFIPRKTLLSMRRAEEERQVFTITLLD